MSRKVFLFVGVFLILASVAFFLREKVFVGNAQLLIQTEPEATVFIDGEQVGTTPFEIKMKPREVEIRLIPTPQGDGLALYETKVKLVEGVQTVIRRFFGPTEDSSSGFVISFQKIGGREAPLAVVSFPEGAEIWLDGKLIDTTPHKVNTTAPAGHAVRLSSSGFMSLEVPVKTAIGYELTAFVKLARLPEEEKEEVVEKPPEAKRVLVEILTTPTGFLRVRAEPSTAATESARVTPGRKYPFVEEKAVGSTNWYKLEYEEGKSGWVSGEYAKKVEENL